MYIVGEELFIILVCHMLNKHAVFILDIERPVRYKTHFDQYYFSTFFSQ